MPDYDFVFDGTESMGSDAFLRSVRQLALAEGAHKDDERIAQLAAAHLGGEAMDWYEEQEEIVQEDWKLLRKAILTQWPTRGGRPAAAARVQGQNRGASGG